MSSDGFVLVDKPERWTSHDVVAKMRRLAGQRKIGHAGTLDPMATGLLVLGLGRSTRLLRFVQGLPKEYLAEARFGVATDTLDADGSEVGRAPLPVDEQAVESILERFRGSIEQVPPMVSAIKQGGRKLYELAREGQVVEREPRSVEVYELELTGFQGGEYPLVGFRVTCSSGTYVRSLADDIAVALGGRAHLVELRRTRIGSLSVEAAATIEQIEERGVEQHLLPPSSGVADLDRVTVDDELGRRVAHGSVLEPTELPITGPTAVLDPSGRLLAVYSRDQERVRPEVVVA